MNRSDEQLHANGSPPPPEPDAPRAHAYDYVVVLSRYRWFLLLFILGGGILAAIYFSVAPQSYTAGATLLPPDKSDGMNLAALMQSGSMLDFAGLSENSSAETFSRILQSRTLADSLITRLDLMQRLELETTERELAIDEVLGNIVVTADRQGFVDITYTVKTGFLPSQTEQRKAAELSAQIVNNAVEVLDKLNQQKSVTKARRSRQFIGQMREIKRAELDSVQRELLQFQQKNKVIALDKQLEASVTGLVEIQSEIQKKELELAMLRQDLNPDARMVENVQRQLSELRSQKARLEGGQIGGEALAIPLRGVPDLTRQYANLKLNLEVATEIYTYLEAQYNQEQIQEARELPTVSVMDYAAPPVRRSAPKRVLMVAVTVAALTVVGLMGVFIYDTYRRKWRRPDPAVRNLPHEVHSREPKPLSTTDISN